MNEDIETQIADTNETTIFADPKESSSWKPVAHSGVKGAVLGVMLLQRWNVIPLWPGLVTQVQGGGA